MSRQCKNNFIIMKQFYEVPQVEVVEMEVEGAVMDGSIVDPIDG